jgi:hypothetical protein
MTNLRMLGLTAGLLAGLTLGLAACDGGDGHDHGAHAESGASAGTAAGGAAALYACPMHPEVTSPGPANCPQCGMPLEHPAGADAAQDDHAGHDH